MIEKAEDAGLVERIRSGDPERWTAFDRLRAYTVADDIISFDGDDAQQIVDVLDACASRLEALEAENARLRMDMELMLAQPVFSRRQLESQLSSLKQDNEKMREALRPFAREAEQWAGYAESENLVEGWNGGPASILTVAHLRAAAAALGGSND